MDESSGRFFAIKRIYDEPADDDGCRVLVDRLWPRGVSKERAQLELWLKDVAPSPPLRQEFAHMQERFADFRAAYEAELDDNPAVEQLLELAATAREGDAAVRRQGSGHQPCPGPAGVPAARGRKVGGTRARAGVHSGYVGGAMTEVIRKPDCPPTATRKAAVVTGASTGIGEATVRALRAEGWTVFAVARRAERLEALAAETGAVAFPRDVTEDADVARLLDEVTRAGGIDTLINIAGGARGADTVGAGQDRGLGVDVPGQRAGHHEAHPRVPARCCAPCGEGTVLNLTSTAGLAAYEGGGGYNAAKFAQHALTGALRLEEAEHNVRVIEVAPGLVQTEEFALNRLGDAGGRRQGLPGRGEAADGRGRRRCGPLRRQRTAPRQPGPDRDPPGGAGRQPTS